MDEQAREQAFMSALVTEHFVLQSAASTTVSEGASRASMYIFSLSSSLVAMGFAAQVPDVFGPLVVTVLPSIFIVGVFTVVRLTDTSVENNQNLRAIARIRRYYRGLTPEASAFFGPWEASDDEATEALAMLGTGRRAAPVLFTMASMVATINALVGGVGVALLTAAIGGPTTVGLAIFFGALTALGLVGLAIGYQLRRFSAAANANGQGGG